MKVLFIGEGRHDIGDASPDLNQPRAAQGTIPTLARRVCEEIKADSIALAWTEIRRFNPAAKKPGLADKVIAAALLAEKKFECSATVVVADQDRDKDRKTSLEDGANRAVNAIPKQRVVWGLAIESVEAWTLGAFEAIAEELGVDLHVVRSQYPRGIDIEELFGKSGKEEHRPKQLLERIAQLKDRHDSSDFRRAVAERTNVESLAQRCPKGFGPFLDQLRSTFRNSTRASD